MTSTLNTYYWDWNMVLQLDPSYEKYLISKGEYAQARIEDAFNESSNAHSNTDQEVTEFMQSNARIEEDDDLPYVELNKDATKRNPYIPMVLKREYENQSRGPMQNVPQLMPPKNILAPGSKIYNLNGNYVYSIHRSQYTKNLYEIVELHKEHLYTKEDKIGINKVVYWFNRLTNTTSEIKHRNTLLTYNLKTAKLYDMQYIQKMSGPDDKPLRIKQYKKVLRTHSLFNTEAVTMEIARFSGNLVEMMVKYIDDYVRKLIPDKLDYAHESAPQEKHLIEIFDRNTRYDANILWYNMFQHRVGKRVEWIKEKGFMSAISDISGKRLTPYQKRVSKAATAIKTDCNPKKLVKTIFGVDYRDLYYKILRFYGDIVNGNGSLMELIRLIKKDELPKIIYHSIVAAVNSQNKERLKGLLSCASSFRHSGAQSDNIERATKVLKEIETYVKLTNRFPEPLDYHTYNDTIRMSEQLQIRVRWNKFNTKDEIQILHDRMSELINRDRYHMEEYGDYSFLNIKSPTNEYSGFKFVQRQCMDELREEGTNMHHCVGGYSQRCLEGSLIFSMCRNGRSWATLQLIDDGIPNAELSFRVIQMYTVSDVNIKNATVLDAIERWRTDLSEAYRANHTIGYSQHSMLHYKYQKLIFKLMTLDNKEEVTERLRDILICDVSNYESLLSAYEQLKCLEEELKPCLDEALKQFVEIKTEDNTNEGELLVAIEP